MGNSKWKNENNFAIFSTKDTFVEFVDTSPYSAHHNFPEVW